MEGFYDVYIPLSFPQYFFQPADIVIGFLAKFSPKKGAPTQMS